MCSHIMRNRSLKPIDHRMPTIERPDGAAFSPAAESIHSEVWEWVLSGF